MKASEWSNSLDTKVKEQSNFDLHDTDSRFQTVSLMFREINALMLKVVQIYSKRVFLSGMCGLICNVLRKLAPIISCFRLRIESMCRCTMCGEILETCAALILAIHMHLFVAKWLADD